MRNVEADLALEYALHTSQTFFLTGKAGTGKTTLLKKIISTARKNTVVVAPTGVAAINAGGSTIHSMFGFPLKIYIPSFDRVNLNLATNKALLKNHLRYRKEKRKIIQELELLIIDEISMVRADLLDAIDYALRYTRRNDQPFGGVQVMLIGDLFQLSPVARDEDWQLLRDYYSSPYFFHAKVWNGAIPLTIELKRVYRQEQQEFIDILNAIRNGNPEKGVLDKLNESFIKGYEPTAEDGIILTTHNYKADQINQNALDGLKTPTRKFIADVSGNFSESAYPADNELILKEGAQIMFLRNDSEGAYFNGKIATVEKIELDDIKVNFQDSNETYMLKREKWENKEYKLDAETNEIQQEVKGSFSQYPIRLAWAITIHKSQGLTFDKAVIDVQDAFAMGQTYVALSRCTNLEGLKLISKVTPASIRVNDLIKAFHDRIPDPGKLNEILVIARKQYARQKIFRNFNFEYLMDDFKDWNELVEMKEIPDKSKAILLCKDLSDMMRNLVNVSRSFLAQLERLFRKYDKDENPEPILERCVKAIEFFTKELFDRGIKPLHEHIDEFAVKQRVKAYLREADKFLGILWGKVNTLYETTFLDERIWNGHQYSSNDLPKSIAGDVSKKQKKGETYEVTLKMFREGMDAKEISDLRSMAQSTIESHLAKWVTQGEIQATEVLSEKKLNKMIPYYEEMDKAETLTLNAIKNFIPFETSYFELKIALAYFQSKKKRVEKQ